MNERYPWLPFLLPLIVYMLVGSLEPTPQQPGGVPSIGLTIAYEHYPLIYSLKLAATAAAIAFVWPAWRKFPLRIGWLGAVVGLVGGVVWIALCKLELEKDYLVPALAAIGLDKLISAGERSSFNILKELAATPVWAYAFLAIRFVGLVLIVPLIEEFCWRLFVMRLPVRQDWWTVPQGETNRAGIALAIALPVLMHPAELVAAIVWFSLIAWLYVRSRNIWECVVAHATTNLVLGCYVLYSGEWRFM